MRPFMSKFYLKYAIYLLVCLEFFEISAFLYSWRLDLVLHAKNICSEALQIWLPSELA